MLSLDKNVMVVMGRKVFVLAVVAVVVVVGVVMIQE